MIRRTQLKRSTKPIARKTGAKTKRATPRRGPLRDPGYLAFLRGECKCVVGLLCVCHGRVGGCEAAHFQVNGMRSKGPDDKALPLCPAHHHEQHQIGFRAFMNKYGFDWLYEAMAHYKLYEIWKEATGVSD